MPRSSRRATLALLAAGLAITTSASLATSSATAAAPTDTRTLRDAVTVEGVMAHARQFQAIADANGGTRASGTAGYDQSAAYVSGLLSAAGYAVTLQPFEYEQFVENSSTLARVSPDPKTYVNGEDYFTMEYSGSGDTTAPLTAVDLVLPPGATANTSTSGCESSDFAGFPAGNIALIQRGTCTFRTKVDNAAAAGASGAIIFNEGQEGRQDALNGTLSQPQAAIPAVGTSFAVGDELARIVANQPVTMHLAVDATVVRTATTNVIADSAGGRADRTVVVGAHLDSVPEGPGINDNGSGAATILEIALQMAELGIEPTNRVRFAFWGAEESGLIGSEHYVAQLTKREIKDIAVNLNFDMLGSPNYARFVYDGDGSATPVAGPTGSGVVEDVFTDYFDAMGLASEPTEFSGRSDYGPFIAAGIPAGGLFTGAEGVKTPDQVGRYGGVAGLAYDPCYHLGCDALVQTGTEGYDPAVYGQLDAAYPGQLEGNLNTRAIGEMSDAAAHATLTFAMTTSAVGGTAKASSGPALETAEFRGSHLQR